MAIATIQETPIEIDATRSFIEAALAVGCPRDQIDRFLRAGVVLQPKQLLASAVARQMDQPGGPEELGFGGARGGGKSHWMLVQMGVDDCQRYDGLKCLLLRKVGKSVKEAFEDLRPKIFGRIPHRYVRNVLTFPNNDSRIVLGHFKNENDIDAYLGLEYDVIGVEEATTLSWRKYEAIMSVNRSSKPGWRPRIYTTTNPGGVGHVWFKDRFVLPARRGLEALTRFIQSTVDDNSFVNPEYRRKLDQLTGWLLRAWRYGDWDIAAGQFFTTFSNDAHVVPPLERVPLAWEVWAAMDYGFTHYTVIYLLAKDGDGNIYIVDEHAERRWLPERHVTAFKEMLMRNGVDLWKLRRFVAGADVFAKRNDDGTSVADTYREMGINLSPANTNRISGAAAILKLLGDVDAGIQPRLFITERCPRLIECLPALEHDPHRPEDVLKWDTDEDGHGGDDPYDAARYGLMAGGTGTVVAPSPTAGYRG